MAMMKDVNKLSCVLQQLAVRKLNIAHKRTLTCLVKRNTKGQEIFRQFRRNNARDRKRREAEHFQTLRLKKIEDKKRIPKLLLPSTIKVGKLAEIAGRTPEQIYHMKAVLENEEFTQREKYALNTILDGMLLPAIVKSLGYRPVMMKEEIFNIREDKDIHAERVTTDFLKLRPRPPIVAVMGHVDHGKTTILDALRRTSVAASEAGGITQSIGAFSVPLTADQDVTFIDTPGHSVFTSMRERGAKVTDIIVLVVAADDGVMEQTIESINMAKLAEATIVVALNKCDKKGSDPDLVIEDLDSHGIKCQEIGGTIPATRISALKNMGLDELVKSIVEQSKKLELNYDPNMQVQGFVLESKMEKGRGNMVSMIVKNGTLKPGKVLVAGTSMAKVKQLLDANGKKISAVHAGETAHVMGWKSLPTAGQMILEAKNEQIAKAATKQREREIKFLQSDDIRKEIEEKRKIEREEYKDISERFRKKVDRRTQGFLLATEKNAIDDSTPHLNIIVKADVDGSMEAIMKILNSYDCDNYCQLSLVSSGIGDLKLSEYELAEELGASIFLFNTNIGAETRTKVTDSVKISQHRVIYHLVDDLIERINAILPPVDKNVVKGEAEVLQVFKRGKQKIAGCKVLSGVLNAKELHAIMRNGSVVHQGPLASMRERATQIAKATTGNECGLMFTETCESEVEVGDRIQCCTVVQEPQKIKWRPPGF